MNESIMNVNNCVVDLDLFKKLDHISLAEHVFPDTYSADHPNVDAGRKLVVDKIIKAVKDLVDFNVRMCPKD